MKKFTKKLVVAFVALVAVVCVGVSLTACAKNTDIDGKVSIDTFNTCAEGNTEHGGFLNVANGTTEVTLSVKSGEYTLTKKVTTDFANSQFSGMNMADAEVVYTFTGTVTAVEGTTYTLGAATACTFSEDWGGFASQLGEKKTGDSTTNPECLEYFYGPYWNKKGNKEMKVTVTDGVLSFEGFVFEVDE